MEMQKCKENEMLTVVTTAYTLLVNLDVFSIHYFGLKKMSRVLLLLLLQYLYACPNMYTVYVQI